MEVVALSGLLYCRLSDNQRGGEALFFFVNWQTLVVVMSLSSLALFVNRNVRYLFICIYLLKMCYFYQTIIYECNIYTCFFHVLANKVNYLKKQILKCDVLEEIDGTYNQQHTIKNAPKHIINDITSIKYQIPTYYC